MTPDQSHLRDCLARWLLAEPERGRVLWAHWSNPKHRNARSREWLKDMAARIARERGA